MVKEYVKELGGKPFDAIDPDGNTVSITIAKSNARYRNHKGKKVEANRDLTTKYIRNEVKQEAIALIDELIVASRFDDSKASNYPHGWLDNNGQNDWEYWKTYIQDKSNTIWEATLNVANTTNGEKILYDISPIKKVGQTVKSVTIPTHESIAHEDPDVKRKMSIRDADYMGAVNHGDMKTAQKMVDEAAKAAGYTVKAYHGTDTDTLLYLIKVKSVRHRD